MRDPGRGDDEFQLRPPELLPSDRAWPSALLFESPEQIYQRVYRVLRPRLEAPPVEVRFEKFANPDSRIRFQDGALLVRVTDLLEGAPAPSRKRWLLSCSQSFSARKSQSFMNTATAYF